MTNTGIRLTSVRITGPNGSILWDVGESVPKEIYDSDSKQMIPNPFYHFANYDVYLTSDFELCLVKNT